MTSLRMILGFPQRILFGPGKWWRWLALAWVVIVIAGLSYRVTSFRPNLVLMLLIVALGGTVLIRLLLQWPALGLVLLIPANILVKYGIGTGTQTEINATIMLIVLLLGVWFFMSIERYETIKIYRSRTTLPLILFLIVALLAFFSGQLLWFNVSGASLPAQIGGLMIIVFSLAAFLLAANLIDGVHWLKWITLLIIIFGAVNVFTRLHPALFQYNRVLLMWGSTSSQFWTWFIVALFSQAWLNKDLRKEVRLALWLILAAALYVSFFQDFEWKSGWMPALVAIIFVVGLRSWLFGLFLGIGGLLVAPMITARLIATDEYSFFTRIEAWQIVGEIIKVNPILGLGPANYYWYTPLYQIRGYTGLNFNSHNQYVDLVAQVGILGLICFLWLFWEVGRVGLEMRGRALSGFENAYLYGALGGLVATLFAGMMGDWTLPFVYNVGMVGMRSSILGWLFLGGLVALERITRQPALSDLELAST